ncbi:MAG: hypothetical protein U0835_05875 [Isosphaeraceae bacterium]
MSRLKGKIADGPVRSLIERFLKANILDGLEEWSPRARYARAVLSPLRATTVLDLADHLDARGGLRDGALRRRLRDLVPDARGGVAALELVRGGSPRTA